MACVGFSYRLRTPAEPLFTFPPLPFPFSSSGFRFLAVFDFWKVAHSASSRII
jgi:hypothetical protein